MEVIPFEEKYRQDFIDFNTDWILREFGKLEEHDLQTFASIDQALQEGAMIFFAIEHDEAQACCMVVPLGTGVWELCKMGSRRGIHPGAGSGVFQAAMQWALDHGAKKIVIVSNRKLKPALHIYEKYGFREDVKPVWEYERGDVAYVYEAS